MYIGIVFSDRIRNVFSLILAIFQIAYNVGLHINKIFEYKNKTIKILETYR